MSESNIPTPTVPVTAPTPTQPSTQTASVSFPSRVSAAPNPMIKIGETSKPFQPLPRNCKEQRQNIGLPGNPITSTNSHYGVFGDYGNLIKQQHTYGNQLASHVFNHNPIQQLNQPGYCEVSNVSAAAAGTRPGNCGSIQQRSDSSINQPQYIGIGERNVFYQRHQSAPHFTRFDSYDAPSRFNESTKLPGYHRQMKQREIQHLGLKNKEVFSSYEEHVRSERPKSIGGNSDTVLCVGGLPAGGQEMVAPQPVPLSQRECHPGRDGSENHKKLNTFRSDYYFANHLLDGRDGGNQNLEAKRLFNIAKKAKLQSDKVAAEAQRKAELVALQQREQPKISGLNCDLEGGGWGGPRSNSLFLARESQRRISRGGPSSVAGSVKSESNTSAKLSLSQKDQEISRLSSSSQKVLQNLLPPPPSDTGAKTTQFNGLPLHANLSKRLLQLATPRTQYNTIQSNTVTPQCPPGDWIPPGKRISVFSRQPHMGVSSQVPVGVMPQSLGQQQPQSGPNNNSKVQQEKKNHQLLSSSNSKARLYGTPTSQSTLQRSKSSSNSNIRCLNAAAMAFSEAISHATILNNKLGGNIKSVIHGNCQKDLVNLPVEPVSLRISTKNESLGNKSNMNLSKSSIPSLSNSNSTSRRQSLTNTTTGTGSANSLSMSTGEVLSNLSASKRSLNQTNNSSSNSVTDAEVQDSQSQPENADDNMVIVENSEIQQTQESSGDPENSESHDDTTDTKIQKGRETTITQTASSPTADPSTSTEIEELQDLPSSSTSSSSSSSVGGPGSSNTTVRNSISTETESDQIAKQKLGMLPKTKIVQQYPSLNTNSKLFSTSRSRALSAITTFHSIPEESTVNSSSYFVLNGAEAQQATEKSTTKSDKSKTSKSSSQTYSRHTIGLGGGSNSNTTLNTTRTSMDIKAWRDKVLAGLPSIPKAKISGFSKQQISSGHGGPIVNRKPLSSISNRATTTNVIQQQQQGRGSATNKKLNSSGKTSETQGGSHRSTGNRLTVPGAQNPTRRTSFNAKTRPGSNQSNTSGKTSVRNSSNTSPSASGPGNRANSDRKSSNSNLNKESLHSKNHNDKTDFRNINLKKIGLPTSPVNDNMNSQQQNQKTRLRTAASASVLNDPKREVFSGPAPSRAPVPVKKQQQVPVAVPAATVNVNSSNTLLNQTVTVNTSAPTRKSLSHRPSLSPTAPAVQLQVITSQSKPSLTGSLLPSRKTSPRPSLAQSQSQTATVTAAVTTKPTESKTGKPNAKKDNQEPISTASTAAPPSSSNSVVSMSSSRMSLESNNRMSIESNNRISMESNNRFSTFNTKESSELEETTVSSDSVPAVKSDITQCDSATARKTETLPSNSDETSSTEVTKIQNLNPTEVQTKVTPSIHSVDTLTVDTKTDLINPSELGQNNVILADHAPLQTSNLSESKKLVTSSSPISETHKAADIITNNTTELNAAASSTKIESSEVSEKKLETETTKEVTVFSDVNVNDVKESIEKENTVNTESKTSTSESDSLPVPEEASAEDSEKPEAESIEAKKSTVNEDFPEWGGEVEDEENGANKPSDSSVEGEGEWGGEIEGGAAAEGGA